MFDVWNVLKKFFELPCFSLETSDRVGEHDGCPKSTPSTAGLIVIVKITI